MAFKDFATYFKRVEIVNLPSETSGGISWGNNSMPGSWRKKVNAGGCRNFPGKMRNPSIIVVALKGAFINYHQGGSLISGKVSAQIL